MTSLRAPNLLPPVVALVDESDATQALLAAHRWARLEGRPLCLARLTGPVDPISPLLPHQAQVVHDVANQSARIEAELERRLRTVVPESSVELCFAVISPHGVAPDVPSLMRQLEAHAVAVPTARHLESSLVDEPSWSVYVQAERSGPGPVIAVVRPETLSRVGPCAVSAAHRAQRPLLVLVEHGASVEPTEEAIVGYARRPMRAGPERLEALRLEVRALDRDVVGALAGLRERVAPWATVVGWGPPEASARIEAEALVRELREPLIVT